MGSYSFEDTGFKGSLPSNDEALGSISSVIKANTGFGYLFILLEEPSMPGTGVFCFCLHSTDMPKCIMKKNLTAFAIVGKQL